MREVLLSIDEHQREALLKQMILREMTLRALLMIEYFQIMKSISQEVEHQKQVLEAGYIPMEDL